MPAPAASDLPHARLSPPWIECGDLRSHDFGTLWTEPGAGEATVFWFDRDRTLHAMTQLFGPVPAEVVLEGRRWDVRALADEAAEAGFATLEAQVAADTNLHPMFRAMFAGAAQHTEQGEKAA